MPSLLATRSLPWQAGTALLGTGVDLPWQAGAQLLGEGGATYTPGSPPGGGTVITPGVGGALYRIKPRGVYLSAPSWDLRDARDDTVLAVSKVSISSDVDSTFWTIRAEGGGGALYAQLLAGDQPARVRFTAEGQTWEFIVDTLARSREFDGTTTSFVGRSLAALSAGPFQATKNWTNEADTVASQICASALRDTGVLLDWRVDDWAVPEGVFSLSGTPLQVVKAFADAVGAVVRSHPWLPILEVLPRYPTLPNEWRTSGVDLDLALDAVLSEQLERVESAEYDGVYLSGQQGGIIGFVRLQGTSGAQTHPYLSDPLLCDIPALEQRARALLGASTGGQVRVPMTLPVLYGAGEPGVLELNQLVRVQDPAGVWYGLLRSVSASFEHGQSRQQVALERHLQLWPGSVAEEVLYTPLRFVPSIDDQAATAGIAFSLDVSGNWADGYGARTYSMRSGSLPTGLALNASSGVISGTPAAGPGATGLALRCVDEEGGMADSNEFDITVGAGSSIDYGVKLKFEDNDAGTPWYSQITNPGTWGNSALSVSGSNGNMDIVTSPTKYGSRAFSTFYPSLGSRRRVLLTASNLNWAAGTYMSSGTWFRRESLTVNATLGIFQWTQASDKRWQVTFGHSANFYVQINQDTWVEGDGWTAIVGTQAINGPEASLSSYEHVEIEVTNTTVKLFVNGGLQGTYTLLNAMGAPTCTQAELFRVPSDGSFLIDEFFVYKNTTPLHSSSFTPAELPA